MSRIGAIVRKLYGVDVKPVAAPNTYTSAAAPKVRPNKRESRLTALKNALRSKRTIAWAIRIVVLLVVLFIVAESIFQYNRFSAWNTTVAARRADVNRELQRRENLIPNIVAAVSRYAAYEQGVFRHVSDVRNELKRIKDSSASPSQINGVLEKALSGLVALAEEYPDLKATNSIQDLIREAANTEDRIADAKEAYNKDCEIFNQYLSVFPGNFFGWIYGFELAPYIGLEEEVKVPVIDLDMMGRRDAAEEAAALGMDSPRTTKQEIERKEDIEASSGDLDRSEGAEE